MKHLAYFWAGFKFLMAIVLYVVTLCACMIFGIEHPIIALIGAALIACYVLGRSFGNQTSWR